jgi:hypothetical protein
MSGDRVTGLDAWRGVSALQFAMPNEPQNGFGEVLAGLERDMANLREALGLLGVKPCCCCGKFFLTTNPANLFASGSDSVCYGCLPNWWQGRCHGLDIADRESIEHSLMRWLIAHHGAKVYRELTELPPENIQYLRLVVTCYECKGTGTMGADRCRHCLGNRNVWVVTLK